MRDLLKNQEAAKPAENVQKAAPEVKQELVEEESQEAQPIEGVKEEVQAFYAGLIGEKNISKLV